VGTVTLCIEIKRIYFTGNNLIILFISLPRPLPGLAVYISNMAGALYYPSGALEFTPGFLVGVAVSHLFSFLHCPIMCLYVRSSVL